MPVVIEKVIQASAQDLIDLEKIYLDYPTAFRFSDLQELQKQATNMAIYGARFNDRLLAAITIKPLAQGFELNHFCTRGLTRRRGVGKELLRQLLPLLLNQPLQMTLCEVNPAMQQLLLNNGFKQHDMHFTLQP